MKFVVQRVSSASIDIRDAAFRGSEHAAANENTGDVVTRSIGPGFVVLIGISQEDVELFFAGNSTVADKMIHKLVNLRIFDDENGKTNLNIDAVNGEMLLISQFTLYADCKHGNRPSFTNAGDPARAEKLYNYIVDKCRELLGSKSDDNNMTGGSSKSDDNNMTGGSSKSGDNNMTGSSKPGDNNMTGSSKPGDSSMTADPSIRIKTGEFGADMKVSLTNDGPFTIILDSEEIM